MTWVKLDDGFATHPKVIGLSDAAFRAYIAGLCYAAQHTTDGFVPAAYVKSKPARDLVSSGLWLEAPDGYRIHDYLLYNPSRVEVEQERSSKRAAGRAGGQAAALARAQAPATPSDTAAAAGSATPSATPSGSAPVPQPHPDPNFQSFWSIYPRHVGRRRAELAFRSACKRASVADVIAGAERYRDDPNRADEYTAHPQTWLNRDGWLDDPMPSRSSASDDRFAKIAREAASG